MAYRTYVPMLEETMEDEYGTEAVDLFDYWGEYDSEEEARAMMDCVIDDVKSGKYPLDGGNYHSFTIHVYEDDGSFIVDVIEIVENIEKEYGISGGMNNGNV